MKILLVNPGETTAPGGVNRTVAEIARHLFKMGHEVTVLQSNPLHLPGSEMRDGFRIIRVGSVFHKYFYGLSPAVFFYLRRHFKELAPDIIHIHGYHTLFSHEFLYLSKRVYPKCVFVFSPHLGTLSHSTWVGKHLWGVYNTLIGRKIAQMYDLICVASYYEKKEICFNLHVKNEKINVISHGVDTIELGLRQMSDPSKIRLIYAGYLLELKGIHYILKTLSILINMNYEVELTIVGEGPYKQQLIKMAIRLGVFKYINWKGFLSAQDLLKEFKQHDVFLMLSMSENFSIIVAEALASGLPVIVSKRTALIEFLDEPGCFGVNYPPDSQQVANLIMEICQRRIKVGPFSDKIRTWDKVADDYERLYKQVVS